MDTSCAALMRLAAAVHGQGYKVALTGEGADEALAGYVWFKTQKIREQAHEAIGRPAAQWRPRALMLASVGGGEVAIRAELRPIGGRPARPAGHVRA